MPGPQVSTSHERQPVARVMRIIKAGHGHTKAPAVEVELAAVLYEAPHFLDAGNALNATVQRSRHARHFRKWPVGVSLHDPEIGAALKNHQQRFVHDSTVET